MLDTYEKFALPDLSKKNTFTVEVNWESANKKTNQCKILKIMSPSGEVAYVDQKHFVEMVFAIGTAEQQRKMIPQTLETVHWRDTILGIQATKDIRKGEQINFPIKISFPCTITQEIIGEVKHARELKRLTPKKIAV